MSNCKFAELRANDEHSKFTDKEEILNLLRGLSIYALC